MPFFRPQTKSALTLHIPVLEKLGANISSFPRPSIHYFYSITNHSLTAESRRDIRRKLPRNIALG